MNQTEVGRRLKEVRAALSLKLEEIGEKTGLSKSAISYMETGTKKPSSVYMYELSKQFNIDINWVLTGDGNMFKPDVELNLNFGEDNKTIKELIYYIENVPYARHDILRYFFTFKKDNKNLEKDFNIDTNKRS